MFDLIVFAICFIILNINFISNQGFELINHYLNQSQLMVLVIKDL
jgi:hypothetical protein